MDKIDELVSELAKKPVPDDPIDRVHEWAKLLARGAVEGAWTSRIDDSNSHYRIIKNAWMGKYPSNPLLQSFEYIKDESNPLLTAKAFHLLEDSPVQPSVFIAYGTEESSAFGLAIEYRLQALNIPVFIDRSIPPGDKWDPHLREKLEQSKFVVCLLAPKTLSRSIYIDEEIKAGSNGKHEFIPIWHSGFDPKEHCYDKPKEVKDPIGAIQAIRVAGETAKAYHDAVEALINRLGIVLLTRK